jgi:hypothetical protein
MYAQTDPNLDTTGATHQRRVALIDYLEWRKGVPYALVGLAPGYAGARFSGEPFNDELHLFERTGFRFSQRVTPWREETSTVVQSALSRLAITDATVSWNALPFHPYEEKKPLVNRTPDWEEVEQHGLHWLQKFLYLLDPGIVIPVGRIAERAVRTIGVTNVAPYVRHPSHGGANLFFRGLLTIVNGKADAEEVESREDGG